MAGALKLLNGMPDLTDALARLSKSLNQSQPAATAAIIDPAAIGEAVVVIPAGGFGYRMRGATEAPGAVTQKALLPLPNGETLIGRLIRQYAAAGLREFVALLVRNPLVHGLACAVLFAGGLALTQIS